MGEIPFLGQWPDLWFGGSALCFFRHPVSLWGLMSALNTIIKAMYSYAGERNVPLGKKETERWWRFFFRVLEGEKRFDTCAAAAAIYAGCLCPKFAAA